MRYRKAGYKRPAYKNHDYYLRLNNNHMVIDPAALKFYEKKFYSTRRF